MVKNPPDNAGDARDLGLTPELGRSPGDNNGNPLQCSCLENSMDRGARRATIHRSPALAGGIFTTEQPMQCTVYRDTQQSNSVTGFYFIGRERRKTMINHYIYLKLQTQE